MSGFVTRRWKLNGAEFDEETYPNEHNYFHRLAVSTDLQYFGRLECELVFDPPLLQLDPEQARQLQAFLADQPDPADAD